MMLKIISKKYIFVFLLFCVQELFMNLIGEYNKTFLAKSIINGKYIVDMLWTLVLYSVVVFSAAFIIFLMYFKEQSLLYSLKKKLLCFVGITFAYEFVKAITYAIVKDKTQSLYFVLGNIYLLAVQIVIYRLFSEIDNQSKEKKGIGMKQLIAATVIIIVTAVFIIISELYFKNKNSNEIFQSSIIFISGFVLAFVTALIQTFCFGSLMREELSEKVVFKSQFIISGGIVGLSAVFFFAKQILPEGAVSGIHGSSSIEAKAENCFSENCYQTRISRVDNHKETMIYYNNTTHIFYNKEKVLSYSSNDPSKSEKTEYFDLKNEKIEGIIEEDIAIVYKSSDGNIEYSVFGERESKGYDKSIYESALRKTGH